MTFITIIEIVAVLMLPYGAILFRLPVILNPESWDSNGSEEIRYYIYWATEVIIHLLIALALVVIGLIAQEFHNNELALVTKIGYYHSLILVLVVQKALDNCGN